ncbi:hypothetical protein JQ596_22450 [Bradyrhizobium manausense]|uniref:hypothetical protein n=1 Tax=Bradyrhizobium TaxID=374 RepID=UPI001BA8B740|nr:MULTISPECIES: hypothetical protein [Bradyrhizobium]MBR0828300.1 hypothetical protein [Bradyrhizobium manausense]UVO25628.1 hypothetical protein KUF59_23850 [Bradyrhizobium arachidis]
MKTISLTIAAAVIAMAGATSGFAAEMPTFEANALPISQAQVAVLGAAHVEQQTQVAAVSATPHQVSVLTPRARATASAGRTIGQVR